MPDSSTSSPDFAELCRALEECAFVIQTGGTAQTYLRRGHVYQQLNSLEAAVEDYSTAMAFNPPLDPKRLAQAHHHRNQCYRQLGRYPEAIADGEKALTLTPACAPCWMELGHVRYWVGDYQGALADLNRAVALNPVEWWAYAFRGRVYAALGGALRAIAELSMAIDEGQQNDPLLYLWRAEVYLSLGGYREAEADCAAGLALNLHDWRLWKCRGAARFLVTEAFRNLAGALGDFTQAIALSSQAEAYLGRGLVYRALSADNAAVGDFSQFIARHPAGPAAGARELASIIIGLTSPPVAVAA